MQPLSVNPETLSLPESHPEIELLRANQVQEVAQAESAGAHGGVDCESWRSGFFDLDKV